MKSPQGGLHTAPGSGGGADRLAQGAVAEKVGPGVFSPAQRPGPVLVLTGSGTRFPQAVPTWDMKTSCCSWAGGTARRAPSVSRSPGQARRCSVVPSARRTSVSPTRNSTFTPAGGGLAQWGPTLPLLSSAPELALSQIPSSPLWLCSHNPGQEHGLRGVGVQCGGTTSGFQQPQTLWAEQPARSQGRLQAFPLWASAPGPYKEGLGVGWVGVAHEGPCSSDLGPPDSRDSIQSSLPQNQQHLHACVHTHWHTGVTLGCPQSLRIPSRQLRRAVREPARPSDN